MKDKHNILCLIFLFECKREGWACDVICLKAAWRPAALNQSEEEEWFMAETNRTEMQRDDFWKKIKASGVNESFQIEGWWDYWFYFWRCFSSAISIAGHLHWHVVWRWSLCQIKLDIWQVVGIIFCGTGTSRAEQLHFHHGGIEQLYNVHFLNKMSVLLYYFSQT